jgi:hypothetical protein
MCGGDGRRYLTVFAVVLITMLALTGCQKTRFTEITIDRVPDAVINMYSDDRNFEHAAVLVSNGFAYLIVSTGQIHRLDLHIKFLSRAEMDDSGTVVTVYFETYDPKIPRTISPADAARVFDFMRIVKFKQGDIRTVKVMVNEVEKYDLQVIK